MDGQECGSTAEVYTIYFVTGPDNLLKKSIQAGNVSRKLTNPNFANYLFYYSLCMQFVPLLHRILT